MNMYILIVLMAVIMLLISILIFQRRKYQRRLEYSEEKFLDANNKLGENMSLEQTYSLLSKLIKENKIRFSYFNSINEVQMVEQVLNNVDNTIDIQFRDVMKEHIDELKQITNKNNIA